MLRGGEEEEKGESGEGRVCTLGMACLKTSKPTSSVTSSKATTSISYQTAPPTREKLFKCMTI